MRADSWVCPECEQGKHRNCNGTAWDFDADELVPCGCPDAAHLTAQALVRRRVSMVLGAVALWLGLTAIGVLAEGYTMAALAMVCVALVLFVGSVIAEEVPA